MFFKGFEANENNINIHEKRSTLSMPLNGILIAYKLFVADGYMWMCSNF